MIFQINTTTRFFKALVLTVRCFVIVNVFTSTTVKLNYRWHKSKDELSLPIDLRNVISYSCLERDAGFTIRKWGMLVIEAV